MKFIYFLSKDPTEICGEDDPICREVGSAICGPEYFDFAKRRCGVYCEYCFTSGVENTTASLLSTTTNTLPTTTTEVTTTTTTIQQSTTTASETPLTETIAKPSQKLTTILIPSTDAPSIEPPTVQPSRSPTTVQSTTVVQTTTQVQTPSPTPGK